MFQQWKINRADRVIGNAIRMVFDLAGNSSMTTRTKRFLIVAAAFVMFGFAMAGWATFKIVAWARDLPNRVVIDGDAIATTFGAAVKESYHHALRDGDSALQTQILNDQFAQAIADDPDAAAWIAEEYRDDILTLVDSNDLAVSAAASDVLSMLPPEPKPKS